METTSGFAEVNGTAMYYETVGEGYPLVFVHAGVADRRMWDEQVVFFSPSYRVIRYDLRGFGKTRPVPGPYAHREDLAALLEFLGVQHACLIGCSMGGMTAMDFALEHPERVDGLVMVGSAPTGLDLDVKTPAKFDEAEEAEERGDWERLLELSAQIWFDGEGRGPQHVEDGKREFMKQMQREAFAYRKVEGAQAMPMQSPAAERLTELKLPVLILCGKHDPPYILAAADHMEQHIAGAKKIMMDSAHLPSMDRPEEFNEIIAAFLDDRAQRIAQP